MDNCCKFLASVFAFTYFFSLPAFSNQEKKPVEIQWSEPRYQTAGGKSIILLSFPGSLLSDELLPVFLENISTSHSGDVNVKLLNPKFEPLDYIESKSVNLIDVSAEINIQSSITSERGKNFITYSFVPLRKNDETGKIEKLVAFNVDIELKSSNVLRSKSITAQTFSSNSVLKDGDWFKIAVVKDGVYKLSYGFLDSLGLNPATINPQNIRVFGNGGGALPIKNSDFRYDDLVENSIIVNGEVDGVFNQDDYILFYGQSQHLWKYNTSIQRYNHILNPYSDTTYYFLTANGGSGQPKRISVKASLTSTPTYVSTGFDDYAFHEKENVNLIKSGRIWFGESFDVVTNYNYNFVFPNTDFSIPACIKLDIASRTISDASAFNISSQSGSFILKAPKMSEGNFNCYYCGYALLGNGTFCFNPSSDNFNINLSYNKGNSGSLAWLNYLEINVRRLLKVSGNQMHFRDKNSIGANKITEFDLGNFSTGYSIWDVTNRLNPFKQEYSFNGTSATFVTATDTLREYIVFNNYLRPAPGGKIVNQNLHGLAAADFIIVYYPPFLAEAQRLADIHQMRDSLSIILVTPQQIYNEYSSGSMDITAIKSFLKMFYDRNKQDPSKLLPRYLLLFGDASYSYKNTSGNTNFIPSYQSIESTEPTKSYVSDDYFGLLADTVGEGLGEKMDIGIGRFPVQTLTEAKAMVDKVDAYTKGYESQLLQTAGCTNIFSSSAYGDWRNLVTVVADDEDGSVHLDDAEELIGKLKSQSKGSDYNVDKIYFDAFPQQSTPGGNRYSGVNDAIVSRVEKGTFILNYTGHGGEVGWAHERVLEVTDINSWTNNPRLALFVTATCEFSRFDDPGRISAGEFVLLNPKGGGIGLLTTTRLVFSNPNRTLNLHFYENAFKKINGEMPRLGDICMITKNLSAQPSSSNHRNFTLLGDPALRLAYPVYEVATTHINSNAVSSVPDTIKALSKVTVKGFIKDENGNKINNFNGILYPTVYDKPTPINTLVNDPPPSSPGYSPSAPRTFKIQKNMLYKGKVSVTNGEFSFTFVVPKDIAYQLSNGRISYYAVSEAGDAQGSFENIIIGGSNPDAGTDNVGPNIALYMNDKKFVYGGMTNESPSLYAVINDTSGINTVGNGIGHDITAVLDDNTEKGVILNDYYESDMNSYQSGIVRYPFKTLSAGNHKLKLKVWDIYNNSSETTTEFVVAPSAIIALDHVLNYPNPFTTHTSFYFEHNQPCERLEVQIQVFTVSGKLVKTIDKRVQCDGYRTDGINWDGKDDYGDKIGRGVYVYRVKVKTQEGTFAEKFEKLVILN